MKHRIVNLLCLWSLIIGATPLKAQQSPLLDNHRWQENSHGVSILPPLGAKVHQRSVDDAILRINAKDGYAINLFIKKSQNEMTIDGVRSEALLEMGRNFPAATVLADEIKTLDDRDMLKIHFFLPRTKKGPWVTAQCFVQLAPTVFVLFQMESPKTTYDLAKPVYDAVISSLQLTDPKQLLVQREQLLDAGDQLLGKLNFSVLKKQLVPEQWFRFVEGDRDIGYMRIRQDFGNLDKRTHLDNAVTNRQGFKVEVMARMEIGQSLYDSVNVCYVSEEHDEKIWSIRTTERPLDARKMQHLRLRDEKQLKFDVQEIQMDYPNTWVETGLMSHRKIQLNRHNPSNERQFQWALPSKAYLSQVDLYLLPMLLADEPDGTWGFYAYHANSSKVSFRTERVEHKADGRYVVYSRLTPEDIHEQVTEYESNGKIVVRTLAGGRKLIPAQRYQIERLWPQFVK